LKRQQRDLTPVLRRPVEPAAPSGRGGMSAMSPLCGQKRTWISTVSEFSECAAADALHLLCQVRAE
jgi:hypothetical protein